MISEGCFWRRLQGVGSRGTHTAEAYPPGCPQGFKINVNFFQKIIPQVIERYLFMGSQRPEKLRDYLAFHCVRHIRIVDFRNGVSLIHYGTLMNTWKNG